MTGVIIIAGITDLNPRELNMKIMDAEWQSWNVQHRHTLKSWRVGFRHPADNVVRTICTISPDLAGDDQVMLAGMIESLPAILYSLRAMVAENEKLLAEYNELLIGGCAPEEPVSPDVIDARRLLARLEGQ